MFDFQKLIVYQRSQEFCQNIAEPIKKEKFGRIVNDQLHRASFSIMLNIAESSSRFSKNDRKYLLIVSRGSLFECVAILEFLKKQKKISNRTFEQLFNELEEISKMLFALIRKNTT